MARKNYICRVENGRQLIDEWLFIFPNIFTGGIIQWEQQIRLRHMTTRKYLCIDADREISLAEGNEDPRTVFRLHSVISVNIFVASN